MRIAIGLFGVLCWIFSVALAGAWVANEFGTNAWWVWTVFVNAPGSVLAGFLFAEETLSP